MSTIKSAVKESLHDHDLTQTPQLSSITSNLHSPYQQKNVNAYRTPQKSSLMKFSTARPSQAQVGQAMKFSERIIGSIREIKKTPLGEKQWRVVGQIHLSFILVETPAGLQLLDQHAVSEIVNYYKIKKEYDAGSVVGQQLLLPAPVELTLAEMSLLEENKELLKKLGWEIDQLSSTSIQVSTIPEILKIENITNSIHEILDAMKEQKGMDIHQRELELIKYESCRSAIMFGDDLSLDEIKALLNSWLQTPNNAACEHGRPAAANISISQMRKFFKR